MNVADPDIPIVLIVFWGLVTFSFIVLVHEAGHFFTARAFGVRVHEFVLGLPGPMLRFRTRSTTFGITAIPLGGYVRIAGMEPGVEDPLLSRALHLLVERGAIDLSALAQELDVGIGRSRSLLTTLADWGAAEATDRDGHAYRPLVEGDGDDPDQLLARVRAKTFRGKKIWQRIVILGMGVFLNLVLAILTFSLVLSLWGYLELTTTVESVLPGTAAEAIGIQAGDVVIAIGDVPTPGWEDVLQAIGTYAPGDSVTVTVERDGTELDLPAVLGAYEGAPYLGIESRFENVRMPFPTALRESIRWTGAVFEALSNLFRPDRFKDSIADARGIVGVSVEAARAAQRGPIDYAWLVALLSLSLGALNIFPIPPLDGGRILLEIVGAVRGKPVSRQWHLGLSVIGALLILSLLGYLVYADTIRYVFNG